MKHTPGPWKAVELDEFTVAIKLDRHHTHECSHIADTHIMTGNLGETVPEALANAHLIAAAPELLEALERATYELSSAYGLTEWHSKATEHEANKLIDKFKSIISKAKGQ